MIDWATLMRLHTSPVFPLMLAGCKVDLQRSVSYCEGAQLAERLGVVFMETSAKTGFNVKEAFYAFLMQIRSRLQVF